MANELDDTLQHYGVKGMRWGHHKGGIKGAMKSYVQKRATKQKAVLDKFHNTRKSNARYMRVYNQQVKKIGNHYKAVKSIRDQVMRQRKAIAFDTAMLAPTMVLAMRNSPIVSSATKTAFKVATSPDNIRRGKNIIQALKHSPIRYVNGAMMKNVIN